MLSSDEAFDERLPSCLHYKAAMHFTPIEVARRAATLLAPKPGMSVLDVGSGVGKFCLVAARAVPASSFIGVEWRGHLVTLANQFATELRLANARFVHANALDLEWSRFDAFYLFNPFAEQLYESALVLDDSIKLDPQNYDHHVLAVRLRLSSCRIGTRVVTYHGFGGLPPPDYELIDEDLIGSDRVELWIKTRTITLEELLADEAA